MAEENQAQQEPQQVTKEPQRVTTKDPKKSEVGKRLAAHNHKKREQKAQTSEAQSELNQYYGIGAVIAVGVIGGLGYYIYQAKKGATTTSREVPNSPALSQLSPPHSRVLARSLWDLRITSFRPRSKSTEDNKF